MPSALITGTNRGIGLEFVQQYLADDWEIYACCRNPAQATELVRIGEKKGLLHLHKLDVRNGDEIDTLSSILADVPIDLLINNAGIADGYGQGIYEQKIDPDIRNYDFEFWKEMMLVNTIAPARVVSAFFQNIVLGKRKIVANLSSGLGSISNLQWPGKYGYCSSKAGLNMVSKGLAEWLKPNNIIVVSISPGWSRTDMGGPAATNSVEEAVEGMRRVLNKLTIDDTGQFWNFDGTKIPW